MEQPDENEVFAMLDRWVGEQRPDGRTRPHRDSHRDADVHQRIAKVVSGTRAVPLRNSLIALPPI